MEKMLVYVRVLELTFLVMVIIQGSVTGVSNQSLLFTDLFAKYHNEIRPVCGEDKPIVTKVGISIRQIIDLNEPKQILTINAWMRLNWFDCQLQWNASSYGGIDNVIVPYDMVWVPDITLYDNAGDGISGYKDYRVSISHTGHVSYNFPTIINSLCKVDVTYFPFDTQVCHLPFGSWAYHGFQLDATNQSAAGDTSTFLLNGEWELVGIPVVRHVLVYSCCPEPYPDVTFYVTIKRKSLFYVLNLLFPCILITSVSLLGFLLPPDSGEKISLEITVLLSLAVFLLVVSETLPPTSENFPYIGLYFVLSMMLVTFSTVLTVVVLNFHFKGQHGRPVPRWIRSLFLEKLGRLLCVNNNSEKSVHPQTFEGNKIDYNVQRYPASQYLVGETNQENDYGKPVTNGVNHYHHQHSAPESMFSEPNAQQQQQQPEVQNQFTPLVTVLKEQLYVVQKIKDVFDSKSRQDHVSSEWMRVAIILDRLFLVLFSLISVTCTLGILLKSAT
ncbi:neuronal acetylcholine receptor subunit alpha-10-like isoform X2 [Gigantopelta aegis]|uniref:neuronal acetylcholine receptor subunit alpha-10-like isoform X2 n=1 Tax=Gigantopelta aegis TaxID=1735272 RepID=UPI001B88DCE9|nr:neuronal acetylcholine receptor subunit alpha-10-like isoform X2 [Gigantopelta aegis]